MAKEAKIKIGTNISMYTLYRGDNGFDFQTARAYCVNGYRQHVNYKSKERSFRTLVMTQEMIVVECWSE